jgi:hypothetical protein
VRRRAREARAAARRLVKESHQLSDRADVLTRETEVALAEHRALLRYARAALAKLRETMRRLATPER